MARREATPAPHHDQLEAILRKNKEGDRQERERKREKERERERDRQGQRNPVNKRKKNLYLIVFL